MDQRLKKGYLQWRCRRGTKELDVVLNSFLDNYNDLSDFDLILFNQLLDQQDTQLWSWLSQMKKPIHNEHQFIIDKILASNR